MAETLQGRKILLVDDDPDVLDTMHATFQDTGATIETASDGNKAVEIAERTRPDLVILDMMLPRRSGFLVMQRIKADKVKGNRPLVIMVTANTGKRHQLFAEAIGVSAYLLKPVRMDRLVQLSAELLAQLPPTDAPPAPLVPPQA